ncbi:unnamed protein product, partial [Toxocara canis]|uniref:Ras-related protein Rab-40B n=1 Tax=Toxocara canis TaxID=6265 RepID=A0A183UXQ3_TOXCA
DTSGQGRFSTIIRSYSRGAQGILLVYDITNRWSFEGIRRWLAEIDEHAPGIPRILIGNRLHLEFNRAVSRQEAEAFARKRSMQYFEISTLVFFNVHESLTELARLVIQRNGMHWLWRSNQVSTLQDLCCRAVVHCVKNVRSFAQGAEVCMGSLPRRPTGQHALSDVTPRHIARLVRPRSANEGRSRNDFRDQGSRIGSRSGLKTRDQDSRFKIKIQDSNSGPGFKIQDQDSRFEVRIQDSRSGSRIFRSQDVAALPFRCIRGFVAIDCAPLALSCLATPAPHERVASRTTSRYANTTRFLTITEIAEVESVARPADCKLTPFELEAVIVALLCSAEKCGWCAVQGSSAQRVNPSSHAYFFFAHCCVFKAIPLYSTSIRACLDVQVFDPKTVKR